MKEEMLCGGKLRLQQEDGVFPLSMDTMALGDFASLGPGNQVWDLGCGSGVLGLLLLGRVPSLHYHGLDASPQACQLAAQNLAVNNLAGQILQGLIQQVHQTVRQGCADVVVANPPYFSKGLPGTQARTGCTPEQLCHAAVWLLRDKGRFCLVYPVNDLAELLVILHKNGLEPKRLRLVAHNPASVPRLMLVEAVKGGRPGLQLLPGLFWYNDKGEKSPDYRRIYHE